MKFPKITYNSPVTLTFALLALGATLLIQFIGQSAAVRFFSVYRAPLSDPLFYLRMFTHVLGHSDMSHFMGNFTVILLVGPMLEEKYGGKRLLIMIIFTAFITGLINVIFFPGMALLGASGIAFMMILLSSFANSGSGEIPLTLICVAVLYLGTEVLNGLFAHDNISQMAHIIGGVCGCAFGWLICNKKA